MVVLSSPAASTPGKPVAVEEGAASFDLAPPSQRALIEGALELIRRNGEARRAGQKTGAVILASPAQTGLLRWSPDRG